MDKFKWYKYRILSFSFLEIFFRIYQNVSHRLQFICRNRKLTSNFSILKIDPFIIPTNIDLNETINIFGHNFKLNEFSLINEVLNANKYPIKPFYSINIRSEKLGNAKLVWEFNKFNFLPRFAIKFNQTNNASWLTKIVFEIDNWNKQNPYLNTVNWYSNIEINLRLINWSFTWLIMDGARIYKNNIDFKKFCDEIWFPLIHKHCRYSYRNPSKYSSANNHLLSEYSGLFIATSIWSFKKSTGWNQYAKKGIEKEIQKQFSEKGVSKEESAYYTQFICDFLLLNYVIA